MIKIYIILVKLILYKSDYFIKVLKKSELNKLLMLLYIDSCL